MKIEVKNLNKDFKGVSILNDINITFEDGKIYGLIGRNGSGKSVFLKILCGFYEATSGEVLYDGLDIKREKCFPPDTRALIEKPSFLPNLSGKENLELLAAIQNKIGNEEIEESLKKVNLYEDRDKKFSKYSLGMKQKLGIAQVIMENPKVMILDEPFNGLDKKSASQIRELLLKEAQKGKIIILATHIKEDVDKLCDIVYSIDGGYLEKADIKNIQL